MSGVSEPNSVGGSSSQAMGAMVADMQRQLQKMRQVLSESDIRQQRGGEFLYLVIHISRCLTHHFICPVSKQKGR